MVRRAVLIGGLGLAGVVVLWLLFTLVFPWVDRQLNDPVMGVLLVAPGVLAWRRPWWRPGVGLGLGAPATSRAGGDARRRLARAVATWRDSGDHEGCPSRR